MAEKELCRLKRKDLLRMLLMQCEETERLQRETDEIKEKLEVILESYERLKMKLDVKDERLNQKDAEIAELKTEIEKMITEKEMEKKDTDSLEEAVRRFGRLLEETQRTVDLYISNMKKKNEKKNPFEPGRTAGSRKRQNASRHGEVVSADFGQQGECLERTAAVNEIGTKRGFKTAVSGDLYG